MVVCEECGNDEASLLGSCIPGEYYCTDCFLELAGDSCSVCNLPREHCARTPACLATNGPRSS